MPGPKSRTNSGKTWKSYSANCFGENSIPNWNRSFFPENHINELYVERIVLGRTFSRFVEIQNWFGGRSMKDLSRRFLGRKPFFSVGSELLMEERRSQSVSNDAVNYPASRNIGPIFDLQISYLIVSVLSRINWRNGVCRYEMESTHHS